MNRFAEILKRTGDRLDLPQPEKSRILLEIASDLEDLYDLYRGQGIDEEEAARRASEKLVVSDEALAQLVQIHESSFRKFLNRISDQAQTRWERVLLTALVIFVALYAGRELFSSQLYVRAGGFVWPILGIGLMTVFTAVFRIYALYIKRDHAIRRLRAGLAWLVAGGCASIVIGLFGAIIETFRAVRMGVADIEMSLHHTIDGALRCSAMLIVSLLTAIAAFCLWFVLVNKARRIEQAEAAWLME
jgi:hypothetical protein